MARVALAPSGARKDRRPDRASVAFVAVAVDVVVKWVKRSSDAAVRLVVDLPVACETAKIDGVKRGDVGDGLCVTKSRRAPVEREDLDAAVLELEKDGWGSFGHGHHALRGPQEWLRHLSAVDRRAVAIIHRNEARAPVGEGHHCRWCFVLWADPDLPER